MGLETIAGVVEVDLHSLVPIWINPDSNSVVLKRAKDVFR